MLDYNMVTFSDALGKLTPQSVVEYGRNSNMSEIIYVCPCYPQV